jgi:hypothetical protein
MDVQINLKLRRSDRSTLLLRKHDEEKSVKREHIRGILVQNFHRRFGKVGETNPLATGYNFEAEKVVHEEAVKFLTHNPHSINSKDLARFERELAVKL